MESTKINTKRHLLSIVGLTFLFLCTVIATGLFFFGSFDVAKAWLTGKHAYLYPKAILVNEEAAVTEKVSFTFHNLSSKKGTVLGHKVSCTCLFVDELPAEFAPNSTTNISLNVEKKQLQELKTASFILYTDLPGAGTIRGQVLWE